MKLNKKQIITIWIGLSLFLPVCAHLYFLKNEYRANNLYIENCYQQIHEVGAAYNESMGQVDDVSSKLELAKGQEQIESEWYNEIDKTRKKNEKISYKLRIIPFGIMAYISILLAIVIAFNKSPQSKGDV